MEEEAEDGGAACEEGLGERAGEEGGDGWEGGRGMLTVKGEVAGEVPTDAVEGGG